jgi:hypothetical protein
MKYVFPVVHVGRAILKEKMKPMTWLMRLSEIQISLTRSTPCMRMAL